MRIDLHCHSYRSPDSLNSFEALMRRMDRRGLDMVAITDHNTIAGALEFNARAPERFLVGEEIKTRQGELLALFVRDEIPPGLSLGETIDRVRAQGGLIGAPHPLDRARQEAIGHEALQAIHQHLDFVEVLNARTTFASDNRLARDLAAGWGLSGSAGSDAHAPVEVGRAYVEMPPFSDQQQFLDSLAHGQICGRLSSPLIHLFSIYARWRKQFGAW